MKKLFLMLTAGLMFALSAACGTTAASPSPTPEAVPTPEIVPTQEVVPTPEVTPAGVARLCEPIGENQYLLLYNTPAQGGGNGSDSLHLYDGETGALQPFASGEGLWYGPEYYLAATDSDILFQNGAGRLFSFPREGGELSELTKSQEDPYVISPDGTKYVIRKSDGVKVCDLQGDTLLAQAEGVTGVLAMEWSKDSSRVAMVTGGGTAVTVWNTDTGETFVCDAQNEHTPEEWVDITRAYVVGDGPILLIDYLCESGVTLVFWDMAENQFLDRIEVTGDATVLDVSDGSVLYEAIPEDGPHTLNRYQCASRENTVLDRYEGFYTAACFCGQEDQVLAFRYDAKAQTGELVRVP